MRLHSPVRREIRLRRLCPMCDWRLPGSFRRGFDRHPEHRRPSGLPSEGQNPKDPNHHHTTTVELTAGARLRMVTLASTALDPR